MSAAAVSFARTKTLLVIMAGAGLGFAAVHRAAGQNWTMIASNQNWTCLAASADGTKLVAGTDLSPIYRSTNSGVTWESTRSPSNHWTDLAASADGNTWVAVTAPWLDGSIYRSTNAGLDWTQISSPVTPNFIACSADGTKLVLAARLAGIFRSVDSGASWMLLNAPTTNFWTDIACSADGTRLVATSMNYALPRVFVSLGTVYRSADSGTTWVQANVPHGNWMSAASSAEGTRLLAANGSVYASADAGITWTNTGVPGSAVGTAADGSRLMAANAPGLIYRSNDSGATWMTTDAGSNYWSSLAASADGSAWRALDFGNDVIYQTQSLPAPLLRPTLTADNLRLAWTLPAMNFALQHNSDLTTTNWVDAADPVLNLTNLQYEVNLSPAHPQDYYRLAAP